MKRLFLVIFATALLVNSGCHIFGKKKPKPPAESKTAAADVEKEFMQRWIDKRSSDLAAQGLAPDAAKAQATAEFKEKFNYTDAARQAK
jgi:hypothetical protein